MTNKFKHTPPPYILKKARTKLGMDEIRANSGTVAMVSSCDYPTLDFIISACNSHDSHDAIIKAGKALIKVLDIVDWLPGELAAAVREFNHAITQAESK